MGSIILDGKEVPCGAVVKAWKEHGMTFEGKERTVRRTKKIDLVIWHWTGGENSARTTYNTLIRRRLGVSFCIDVDGVVWQYLDPVKHDPYDVGGSMGRRGISIEVANYGFVLRNKKPPKKGRGRPTDKERIHGVRLNVARFWPEQVSAIAALTKSLCVGLGIPLRFPRESDGSLALRELTRKEKRNFTGIIGHFHKTKQKYDPGFQIFRDLNYLEESSLSSLMEKEYDLLKNK